MDSKRLRFVQDLPKLITTSGALILVGVLAVYPLVVFILTSFRLHTETGPGELTLRNYMTIFSSRMVVGALWNTLVISTSVAACAGTLGTLFAWLHARVTMPGLRILEPLTVMPFFLSPLLGAIVWWILASPKIGILNHLAMALFGLSRPPFNIYSIEGIILVMTLYYTPYIYLFTSGSFRRMDPALEESARICGTGIIKTALRVGIPLSTPAILSGFLIIFVISAGAFGVPIILGVPARIHTLSTRIFTMMETFPPDIGGASAVGGLLILLTAGGIWFQRRIISKRSYITVTGKGYRPQRMFIGKWAYVALALNLSYILLAILIPLGALLLSSLNRVWRGSFRWDEVTLANWENILFKNDLARMSIKNSFILGVGGAFLSVLLCSFLAYLIHRGRSRLRGALDYTTTLPVGVPGVVMGMAFLIAWVRTPLYGFPLFLMMLAYMTRYLPYGVRTVSSALLSISPELEESSQVCGAPFLMTLRRVTAPLLRPGMLSAYILLFIVFFREYPVSLLLYTERSIPMAIAVYIILDNQPLGVAAAFALLQTILLLGAALLFRRIAGEQELRV